MLRNLDEAVEVEKSRLFPSTFGSDFAIVFEIPIVFNKASAEKDLIPLCS